MGEQETLHPGDSLGSIEEHEEPGGGAGGADQTASTQDAQTEGSAEAQEAQAEEAADAQGAQAEAARDPSAGGGATSVEPKSQDADAERVRALGARLLETQVTLSAAMAGVPRERAEYVARMADVSGIDPGADDAQALIDAAVARVLHDVPELRGRPGAGTGSAGNFARAGSGESDADETIMEKIRRNILGVGRQ